MYLPDVEGIYSIPLLLCFGVTGFIRSGMCQVLRRILGSFSTIQDCFWS